MLWLRRFFVTTAIHNISVRAIHIPGYQDRPADALSRGSVQAFRRMRPDADPTPASWDWKDFVTPPRPQR